MSARGWLALLLAIGAGAGILLAGEPVARALRYERNALLDGQLWRALTGHLVHLSWSHLGFNLGLGALAVALFGRDLRWPAALVCALGTSAGLFLGSIRVPWYAGLSGVLYGLLAYGALCASRRDRRWLLAVALLTAKVIADEFRGNPVGFDGNPIIVDAHLYGALSGALAWAMRRPGPDHRPSRSRQ
jgi:rhomboid family GlyGly-CTERM serine protease